MAGPFFGAAHGQVIATTNAQPLINGLTVSQLVTVTNSTKSIANAYIFGPNFGPSTGYTLEPGQSVVVDTNNSVNTWNVSTDGSTCRVSWIANRLYS